MRKFCLAIFVLLVAAVLTNCGGGATKLTADATANKTAAVQVSSPSNNATVNTSVTYTATATTTCAQGIAKMGVYTTPGTLAYSTNGASLNTTLTLSPGTYQTQVTEWDNCGGTAFTPVNITVAAASASGNSTAGTTVEVSAPVNNSAVASQVQFVATSTTSCPAGIGSMGIYTGDNKLAYQTNGSSLNTTLNFDPGTYNTTVQAWDNCGGSGTSPVMITVAAASASGGDSSAPSGATTISDLQKSDGWTPYVLLPPSYAICSSCSVNGPQTTLSSQQGVSSPSLTGASMKFTVGGQTQYSDGLWNNHLVGDFSSHGKPDPDQSLSRNVHNFTYDVYFYTDNLGVSQALEFDINQFVDGKSYIWGHECRIVGGNEWDIWDNQAQAWHPTGIPCNPQNNTWNHLTIQAQRTSDNHLLFQSITLNGKTSTLNYYESPTSTGWKGITINYQQDGNSQQQQYSVWLDKVNFTYW
ncbi:MAG TPA: hypothetical protein VFA89_14865 [Terriglobales bacterium]|nr:hypothetical protein [Terriglobales bacterium]